MEGKRRIGALLHRMDLLLCYHIRKQDRDLIPPAQMRMLEYVSKNEGCTQAELAEAMQVTPASVAQSIKRMEASGFIERDARKENLRANSLRITEAGIAAAYNCRQVFDRLEERMYTGFSEEEKETMRSLAERLIANLESEDTGYMNNMELSKLLKDERK